MRAAAALLSTVLIATACHAGGNAEETRPDGPAQLSRSPGRSTGSRSPARPT